MKRREFLGLAGAALISVPKISIAQTNPSKTLRIVVVANRYHEADGLMAALCNQMAHSPDLSAPYNVDWPRWPRVPIRSTSPKDSGKPRCLIDVFKAPSDKAPTATMEIWCIDDLANTGGDSGKKVTAMNKSRITGRSAPMESLHLALPDIQAFPPMTDAPRLAARSSSMMLQTAPLAAGLGPAIWIRLFRAKLPRRSFRTCPPIRKPWRLSVPK